MLAFLGLDDAAALGLVRHLVDFAVKGSILIVLIWGASFILRGSSASVRHLLWTSTVIALIILPILPPLVPSLELKIIPELVTGRPLEGADVSALDSGGRDLLDGQRSGVGRPPDALKSGRPWTTWAAAAWVLGGLLTLVWISFGKIGLILIDRRSSLLSDGSKAEPLDELRRHLGLRRRVRLFQNPTTAAAINRGLARPRIILPSEAMGWNSERLRVVFLHELAHIKRLDSIVDVFINVALVVFWFHPLVWLACRRLRAERERACDDAVLTAGIKASDYASHLMEVASEVGSKSKPLWQVVTISQGSSLKDRLLCILDPKLNRGKARPLYGIPCVFLLAGILLPIASARLWNTPARAVFGPSGSVPGNAGASEQPPLRKESAEPIRSETPAVPNPASDTDSSQRVRVLFDMLGHEDTDMRILAVRSIAGLSAEVRLEPLLLAMANDVTEVRKIALAGLAVIEEPRAWLALEKALEDASSEVRLEAVKAGAALAPRVAVPLLIKAMNNEVARVRRIAIRKLIEIDDPSSRETIRLALDDKDGIVRRAAADYFRAERTGANAG
jgi:beta-lactamase regulating signal transducer with metallopeptidase domain